MKDLEKQANALRLAKRIIEATSHANHNSPIGRCGKKIVGRLRATPQDTISSREYYEIVEKALSHGALDNRTKDLLAEDFGVSYLQGMGLDGFADEMLRQVLENHPELKKMYGKRPRHT